MRIGYPCINNSLNCTPNNTFRLINYSEKKLISKVQENLDCLEKTLFFNVQNNILFFRIGSGLIPFASHEICCFNWQKHFEKRFKKIGDYTKKNKIRISMHPDQFVVLNSIDKEIVKRSIREIDYHCELLDLMGLDDTAKVQIHVGGVYNDKKRSIDRFIRNYSKLKLRIKKRLVIENDHVSYSLKDCLFINKLIKIPILLDVFHHECLNNGEDILWAVKESSKTWNKKDGTLMIDYSSQKKGKRMGVHTETIDIKLFASFLNRTIRENYDIMLEIKDKEKSAIKAIKLLIK